MNIYGVIMAGGGGTRFWPLSRKERPKQFLNLTGADLMVNETIDRLEENVDKDNIFVVTNETQAELLLSTAGGRLDKAHILAEPAARNTAACIGYAAMEIQKKYGEGVMCVLPSDHYIKNHQAYQKVMGKAIELAETTGKLITIGIRPVFPATGYGYIQYNKEEKEITKEQYGKETPVYTVREFVEKPDEAVAEEYMESGDYLWNSGMFVWKTSTILSCFETLLPDIYSCLKEMESGMGTPEEREIINRVYPGIPKISIDYGIMERAKDVLVLEGSFGWNDVGSFDALEALYEADKNGNVSYGKRLHVDTHNCISYGTNRLIATLGVENLIIVEADDAVLVCHKDKAQEIKKLVEKLEEKGMEEYL